jgi:hypothetical protein
LHRRIGPFYVHEIARALAREPGRAKFDSDEARLIADHMFLAFEHGEFCEKEVVVSHGSPPRIGTIPQAKDEASARGYQWIDIDPNLWYAGVALTYAAAKRYIESCGFAGAERVLLDWFADAPTLTVIERPKTVAVSQIASPPQNSASVGESLRKFVGRYIAAQRVAGCHATKQGLERKWRSSGKTGHREQLRAEFDRVMGARAHTRGRPPKLPKKIRRQ